MRFKSYQIFKLFVEFNVSSGYNDEYWVIVNILHKRFIGFNNFEVMVKMYFCRNIPFLVVDENHVFIIFGSRKGSIVEFIVTKVKKKRFIWVVCNLG